MTLSGPSIFFSIWISIFLLTAVFHTIVGKLIARYLAWGRRSFIDSSYVRIMTSFYNSITFGWYGKKYSNYLKIYETEKGERLAGHVILFFAVIMLLVLSILFYYAFFIRKLPFFE